MEEACRNKYMESLVKGVEGMWVKQRYTDVIVKTGAQAYGAHKVLLGALSNYFKDLFMHEQSNIVAIDDVDSVTFETVLKYIYTGKTEAVRQNTESVLTAAVKLQISCLQEICEDFLSVRLTSDTCVRIYKLASGLSCVSLTKKSWAYILEFFESVVSTKEFMNLTVEELISIINDDDLNTSSEEVVCEAVLSWSSGDPNGRRQYLEKLFGYVRFPLIKASYLEQLRKNPIIQSDACQQILNEFSTFLSTGTQTATVQNPNQFHCRTEEMICVVGTRSRHPNPETTEIKCFSFNRDAEYKLAPIPEEPGACYAVCGCNNDMYLSGGYIGQRRVMRYVSSENKWQTCADLVEGRWGHSMTAVDGNVYIVGGNKKIPEPIASIEKYNPSTDTTSVVGSLEIPVSFAAITSLGGKIFIIGGKLGKRNICRKIQCFDTVTKECMVVAEMPRVDSTIGRAVAVDEAMFVFYNQGEVVMYEEGKEPEIVASGVAFDHFGVVVHNDRVVIDGSYGNQSSTVVFDPATREIEPFSRPVKVALCNFYCMPIVMSRNLLQSLI